MIRYKNGAANLLHRLCQSRGSVFPVALMAALPSAMLSALLKLLVISDPTSSAFTWLSNKTSVLNDSAAWNGFSVMVGFLVVFRTSQAHSRFWEACKAVQRMQVEWYNLCSQLIAFCAVSKVDKVRVWDFQQLIVHLFSVLDAVAFAEISDSAGGDGELDALTFDLIGPIDQDSLEAIRRSDARTALVYQWIQKLVIENIDAGVIGAPAPLVAAALSRGSSGLVAFGDALTVSSVPFPFPYAQVCDTLLMLHWLVVPFLVSTWASTPYWAAIFSFVQVFILWSLNFIAVEIENPFGMDANDIDARYMHVATNRWLALLNSDAATAPPKLPASFSARPRRSHTLTVTSSTRSTSLATAWAAVQRRDGSLLISDTSSNQGSHGDEEVGNCAPAMPSEEPATTLLPTTGVLAPPAPPAPVVSLRIPPSRSWSSIGSSGPARPSIASSGAGRVTATARGNASPETAAAALAVAASHLKALHPQPHDTRGRNSFLTALPLPRWLGRPGAPWSGTGGPGCSPRPGPGPGHAPTGAFHTVNPAAGVGLSPLAAAAGVAAGAAAAGAAGAGAGAAGTATDGVRMEACARGHGEGGRASRLKRADTAFLKDWADAEEDGQSGPGAESAAGSCGEDEDLEHTL